MCVGGRRGRRRRTRLDERRAQESPRSTPVPLDEIDDPAAVDIGAALSKNGLSLYFTSSRLGGVGGAWDIWVAQRNHIDEPFGPPVNLGEPINSAGLDGVPCFSRDGLSMYFASNRDGAAGLGGLDIYGSKRTNRHDDFGWGAPVNLGPAVNGPGFDTGPALFEFGRDGFDRDDDDEDVIESEEPDVTGELYFSSARPEGMGANDIWMSKQFSDGTFGPAELIPELGLSSSTSDVARCRETERPSSWAPIACRARGPPTSSSLRGVGRAKPGPCR